MSRPPAPPGGATPPTEMLTAAGERIALKPIAADICTHYRALFPVEQARYGEAGNAWCLHDNQYLLAWAIQDARGGTVDLVGQALWLADVLHGRDFPVDRLARDLDLAADAVGRHLSDPAFAERVSQRLRAGAVAVAVRTDY